MCGKLYAGIAIDPTGEEPGHNCCVCMFQESEGSAPRMLQSFANIEEVEKLIEQLQCSIDTMRYRNIASNPRMVEQQVVPYR